MPKMIQIRDVPDDVHAILKARAASESMSLSDYLKRELKRTTSFPTIPEWLELVKKVKPIRPGRSAAEIIRAQRDAG